MSSACRIEDSPFGHSLLNLVNSPRVSLLHGLIVSSSAHLLRVFFGLPLLSLCPGMSLRCHRQLGFLLWKLLFNLRNISATSLACSLARALNRKPTDLLADLFWIRFVQP